jgi:hypothetical protein
LKYHLLKRRDTIRRMRVLAYVFFWLSGLILTSIGPVVAQAPSGGIHFMEIEGVINPVTANYLNRVLEEAAAQEARLVVLTLDTPGGLETSMRIMTQDILSSSSAGSCLCWPFWGSSSISRAFYSSSLACGSHGSRYQHRRSSSGCYGW